MRPEQPDGAAGPPPRAKQDIYDFSPMVEDEDHSLVSAPDGVDHTKTNLDPQHAGGLTSGQQLALKFALCISTACVYVATSLLVAFFPKEAQKRGLDQIDIGIVFALLPASWFIAAPLWAMSTSFIAPRWMMIVGIATISMCLLAFSFLDELGTRLPFFTGALIIRSVQGIASAAAMTGSYMLVASAFPTTLGSVVGGALIFCCSYICGTYRAW